MSKTLIITEKPSVGRDIVKALGGFHKKGDYYESNQYILSSAIGHLLKLCVSEEYEAKRGKWTLKNLPIIPPSFSLKPIEKTRSRLKLLLQLIKRNDIKLFINACDAGREGELIFHHIMQYAKTKKPQKRLWLQSMTPSAIQHAFTVLRKEQEMQPLADAAVCRSEADWLVGINGTRALTAFNSSKGGFQLTTVGRVQTPTLMLLVEREDAIKKFVKKDYWEVHGTFQAISGTYTGRWFDENFTGKGKDDLKSERVWDLTVAEAISNRCQDKAGKVTEESKHTTTLSPPLFDLTSLQRIANKNFGYSAKRTLQLAQALYERYKAITYPRTDARALPEDYIGTVRKTLGVLAKATGYGPLASTILEKSWLRPQKRIFDNARISDHFAIIPTSIVPKNLSDIEHKIYDLIARRFLAIFYPPAEFLVTTRITRVEGEPFKSSGKVLLNSGWLAVYGKEPVPDNTPILVPVQPDEIVQAIQVEIVAAQTKPPARFTEAKLLSAMENAGKFVDDDDLREAMSEKGLGTPATRAAIIEGLLNEKYLIRNNRELCPTAKAFSLKTLLQGLGISELRSAELTGNWEFKLKQIEHKQMVRPEFMREIADMTRQMVAKAKRYENDTIPGDFGVLKTPCPKCGGVIREIYREFQCSSCDFTIWKIIAGRQFEVSEMETLLANHSVGPLSDFYSKKGKTFSALIRLTPDFKLKFDFTYQKQASYNQDEKIDLSGQQPVGKCPKCGANVFEYGTRYICEKSVVQPRTCDFSSGTVVLKQPITRSQMSKLLNEGKTDLLSEFISKKGRPFKAFLVLKDDGRVGFEFTRPASKH